MPYQIASFVETAIYQGNQGPVSICDRSSYRKNSWSLEAARFDFRIVQSLWNLTGSSAALLPKSLSDFKSMWYLNCQSRDFTICNLIGYWNGVSVNTTATNGLSVYVARPSVTRYLLCRFHESLSAMTISNISGTRHGVKIIIYLKRTFNYNPWHRLGILFSATND